jgi:hypothetical protein
VRATARSGSSRVSHHRLDPPGSTDPPRTVPAGHRALAPWPDARMGSSPGTRARPPRATPAPDTHCASTAKPHWEPSRQLAGILRGQHAGEREDDMHQQKLHRQQRRDHQTHDADAVSRLAQEVLRQAPTAHRGAVGRRVADLGLDEAGAGAGGWELGIIGCAWMLQGYGSSPHPARFATQAAWPRAAQY